MARLNQISLDEDLATKGRWVDYRLDVRLLIARSDNPAYRAALLSSNRDAARRVQFDGVDVQKFEDRAAKAAARHILLGWENIDNDDGTPMAYSPEAAEHLLTDPTLRELYDFVMSEANEWAAYQRAQEGDDEGNSPSE